MIPRGTMDVAIMEFTPQKSNWPQTWQDNKCFVVGKGRVLSTWCRLQPKCCYPTRRDAWYLIVLLVSVPEARQHFSRVLVDSSNFYSSCDTSMKSFLQRWGALCQREWRKWESARRNNAYHEMILIQKSWQKDIKWGDCLIQERKTWRCSHDSGFSL